jgi:hypothetical protein
VVVIESVLASAVASTALIDAAAIGHRASQGLDCWGSVGHRPLDDLVEFASVEPHASARGALVDFDA